MAGHRPDGCGAGHTAAAWRHRRRVRSRPTPVMARASHPTTSAPGATVACVPAASALPSSARHFSISRERENANQSDGDFETGNFYEFRIWHSIHDHAQHAG